MDRELIVEEVWRRIRAAEEARKAERVLWSAGIAVTLISVIVAAGVGGLAAQQRDELHAFSIDLPLAPSTRLGGAL